LQVEQLRLRELAPQTEPGGGKRYSLRISVKIAKARLATVKGFRRATYRPIEKNAIDESSGGRYLPVLRVFSHARAIAHDGCSINYGIAIRRDTDEAIRKSARILSVVIRRRDLKIIFAPVIFAPNIFAPNISRHDALIRRLQSLTRRRPDFFAPLDAASVISGCNRLQNAIN
jgi:hypothetical protein